MEISLAHVCSSLRLPKEVAEILLDQGWSVSRLAVLHDDADEALPILLEQIRQADAVAELSGEDIIRLLGSCNLFAGLSWKAEASNVGCLAEAFVRNVLARTQEKSDVLAKASSSQGIAVQGSGASRSMANASSTVEGGSGRQTTFAAERRGRGTRSLD